MRCIPRAAGIGAALLLSAAAAASEMRISSPPTAGPRGPARERTVVAYSFHGTLRCTTCLLVEQEAERVIRGEFGDELGDGSLVWRSVNIRLPENRRFAEEYRVASWALVLVEYRGDTPWKWRNLALAGELVHGSPAVFRRYLGAEVRALLDNTQATRGEIR